MPFEGLIPTGATISGIINVIMYGLITIGILGGIIVFFWKVWNPLKRYPIDLTIWAGREKNLIEHTDKARRVRNKEGEIYYDFKKLGIKWRPPSMTNLILKRDVKKGKEKIKDKKTGKIIKYDTIEVAKTRGSHLYLHTDDWENFDIVNPDFTNPSGENKLKLTVLVDNNTLIDQYFYGEDDATSETLRRSLWFR